MIQKIKYFRGFFHYKLTGLIVILAWSSCNIINPPEPVPSYVNLKSFDFSIKDNIQGSSSNKIEDGWLYIDGNLQGVYELPASVPVLESGTHSIRILPGIYFNGIKSQRFPYPFYASFDTVLSLQQGVEISLQPRSSYVQGLAYTTESFDNNGGFIFDSTAKSLANLAITTDPSEVFEGNGSGKVILDSAHFRFEIATPYLSLPHIGSQRTFVEFNYKTTHYLQVGIYAKLVGGDESLSLISLKPNTEWNKMYLEITNSLLYYGSEASVFKVFFYSTLSNTSSTGIVYLDNFKLINN